VARSAVAAALAEAGSAPVVVVAGTPSEADSAFADLESLAGEGTVHYLPQRESLPSEDSDPHVEISAQRVDAFAALLAGRARLLVTTSRGLVERTPIPADGEGLVLRLRVGDKLPRSRLAARLSQMGFESVRTVGQLGEVAVRGGIVDVFPFAHAAPLRIELWDDEIVSLRHFELLTQRSVDRIAEAALLPIALQPLAATGGAFERHALLELLPVDARLIEFDPARGEQQRARLWEEIVAARFPEEEPEVEDDERDGLRPAQLVIPPPEADVALAALGRIQMGDGGDGLDLGIRPPPPIERDMGRLAGAIRGSLSEGARILLMCDNQGQLERVEEILVEHLGKTSARGVTLALGSISGGFQLRGADALLVLTDHEIFRRSRHLRRGCRFHGSATLESIASLRPGDYVVHIDHGIGRYRGLERVEVGGETIETLTLEYADHETLRVPHYRLDLIERWTSVAGPEGGSSPPTVHKLGGKRWRATRGKAVESIREMAAELLELNAHRKVTEGFAADPETKWQREMESAFLYEDTRDQQAAWEDVRADMESPQIMDRLICGDVGFGKTEIAIRAAFKAAQSGKQVAVLAPTTILVGQHLRTFRERLAGFPVRIEGISRLQSAAQQSAALQGAGTGAVDVLIGTHRLLSPDVRFHDLGLLIVDEEQRFGVHHKERIKAMKRSVDVLTLTATPIPRTLQLALGGIRDMSLIETAPRDRMPVITHVLRWSDAILEDAMRRELDRGGQVFFVHDRIDTIAALAERVRRLVPDARVGVGHGRLKGRELERTMAALVSGELDVLVCTSIIENGLDVPTANTMIVHRADRFGLAQLYQIRGRVGRSHQRAYCYLLVPDAATPESEMRLRVLEHHTELGSGYQVALRDLQQRGAGNLLGTAQSGFAQAIGFDTYQRLLQQTVRRLTGEGNGGPREPPQVSLAGDSLLPDAYVPDPDTKLHFYRRLANADRLETVDDLHEELRDRFGPLPEAADRLLAGHRLKLLGGLLGVEWIRVSREDARVTFRADAVPRLRLLRGAFTDRLIEVEVRRSAPLSLVLRRAGVESLLPTLLAALEMLWTAEGGNVTTLADNHT